jgi:hypothetical protein
MLTFKNRGQELVETNFWDSNLCTEGYFFLSISDGAFRLLVPDSRMQHLRDMDAATQVIVSVGSWPSQERLVGIEILFDDQSDTPFALHFGEEQTDRRIAENDQGFKVPFTILTRHKTHLSSTCKVRLVERIPCLLPWQSA